METVSFKSPREVTIQVIQSRFNLFWWEAVEVYDNRVLRSLGQFRSQGEAVSYIEECHLKNN